MIPRICTAALRSLPHISNFFSIDAWQLRGKHRMNTKLVVRLFESIVAIAVSRGPAKPLVLAETEFKKPRWKG
jgi:hypothetical protein